jgi:hypothetical protein
MGSQIHTYYTAALAPPLALVLGITVDMLVINRTSQVMRVSGAVLALASLLSSWLILGGTAEWPSWLPTAVLGGGTLAVSSLVIRPPIPRVEGIAAGVLAAALLCGPGRHQGLRLGGSQLRQSKRCAAAVGVRTSCYAHRWLRRDRPIANA